LAAASSSEYGKKVVILTEMAETAMDYFKPKRSALQFSAESAGPWIRYNNDRQSDLRRAISQIASEGC
jgi:hypothetical protein